MHRVLCTLLRGAVLTSPLVGDVYYFQPVGTTGVETSSLTSHIFLNARSKGIKPFLCSFNYFTQYK
jgi:hypothetical protein